MEAKPGAALRRAQEAMMQTAPAAARSPLRPRYHIAAPAGWINDPNGLIQTGGVYHVFYQLHPYSPEWGPMHWGHAASRDLAHWEDFPIALAPDQPYEDGCFSGCAVDAGGVLTLFYTAHRDGPPLRESQCAARSFDGGRTFVKDPQNPLIPAPPEGFSADFRDPKVWRGGGGWHMIVGSSHGGRGCALLYDSPDLSRWEYRGIFAESDGSSGTMWECPNYCEVDGRGVFLFSPIGMPGHKNVYQTGSFDARSGKFTGGPLRELDHGVDFYAAQAFQDERGRALLVAWMDRWGEPHPTAADGWAGLLTLPRELHVQNGRLVQQPAPELALLRGETLAYRRLPLRPDGALSVDWRGQCLELELLFRREEAGRGFTLWLDTAPGRGVPIVYDARRDAFAAPHGVFPHGADLPLDWVPRESPDPAVSLRVFTDACSVEAFASPLVFTSRIAPDAT